jgi:hypothetical protein
MKEEKKTGNMKISNIKSNIDYENSHGVDIVYIIQCTINNLDIKLHKEGIGDINSLANSYKYLSIDGKDELAKKILVSAIGPLIWKVHFKLDITESDINKLKELWTLLHSHYPNYYGDLMGNQYSKSFESIKK